MGDRDGGDDRGRPAVDGDDVVGRPGTVTLAVPGGARPGEVRVVLDDGVVEHFIAWCDRALPEGSEVLVVAWRGRRRVDVEPWLL